MRACAALLIPLIAPSLAFGAEGHAVHVAPWSVTPFVLLLVSISLMPLVAGHFWHNDRNKLIVVAVLSLPVVVYLAVLQATGEKHSLEVLFHELGKYFSFIVMLGTLYIVAGGIVVRGDFRPTARVNATILGLGALVTNLIGTTGASVLLIRPLLRINARRSNTLHLPLFFIFIVSNLGGCLTPLGDPPLYIGYLHGVPFFWTLRMWREFLLVNGLALAAFVAWDRLALRREPEAVAAPEPRAPFAVDGKINLLLFLGVTVAIVIDDRWLPPGIARIWDFCGREAVMIPLAILSLWLTPRSLRNDNGFTWAPIAEVAILFVGIFITMVPALQLLEVHGHELGLTEPWHYFWVTGLLSAGLDNAPTYLAFTTMAAGSGDFSVLVDNHVAGLDGPTVLQAISCGAVFMGALTYIGNGPNFMVKAIAERAGYRMPTFVGYSLRAIAILIPINLLVTLLFFR